MSLKRKNEDIISNTNKSIKSNVSKLNYITFNPTTPPPFNSLGLFTFLRTYARRHDENDVNSTIESWEECITRVINASNTQLHCNFSIDEMNELFYLLYNLKCSVAGRFLWTLNTKTVDKMGLMSLQNCAYVNVDEPVKPFIWTMNFLMLGAGVGYSIMPEHISKIPEIKYCMANRKDTNDADYIVSDSREGWIKLLAKILKGHFYSGKSFTYSCILLRSKGAPIKGFGGTASGPDVFCDGLLKIERVLNNRAGQKLRPIDALDVMNIIGGIVVAGNTRRSAQICLGDCNDIEFMRAKRWDLGSIPNWRCYSNNSVICNDINDIINNEEFWQGYNGNGEPYGLINLNLMRKCGRLNDFRYPDPGVQGTNPSLKAGTKIITMDGIFPIEKLEDTIFMTKNLRGEWQKAKCWLSGKNKQLYRIKLNTGIEYYATPEHKWPVVINGITIKTPTVNLEEGHILPYFQHNELVNISDSKTYEDGFCIGWLYGDGWNTVRKDGRHQYGFIVSYKDNESGIKDIITNWLNNICDFEYTWNDRGSSFETNVSNIKLHNYLQQFGVSHKNKGLPTCIWTSSEEFRKGFIDGIFSSDGCISGNNISKCVSISQSNIKLIDDLQELLGFYGIMMNKSIIQNNNPSFPNGKKYNKIYTRYVLRTRNWINIIHFKNTFNLTHIHKQEKLNNFIRQDSNRQITLTTTVYITEVELTNVFEDVWDISVYDDTHCFQLSGCITGNCAEICLNNFQTCCLSELFLPNITSKEELFKCVSYLYRMCKHSLTLPCPDSIETETIVHQEFRIGIGVTGYLQATEEQKQWLPECYEYLRNFDIQYSLSNGLPSSIKLTTAKPSGTLSLLGSVTPGVHPGFSQYFIRRVRISSDSPLIKLAEKHGYNVEWQHNFDNTIDNTTKIISFPMSYPDGTVVAKDCTAVQQLEYAKRLQADWSDNSISQTCYYKKEELPLIKEWLLNNYNTCVKSVSFLLHNEHGFKQAPYEEITKEVYDNMMSTCRPIINVEGVCYTEGDTLIGEGECQGGVCPIR